MFALPQKSFIDWLPDSRGSIATATPLLYFLTSLADSSTVFTDKASVPSSSQGMTLRGHSRTSSRPETHPNFRTLRARLWIPTTHEIIANSF